MSKSSDKNRSKKIWAVISPVIAALTVWAVLKQNGGISPERILRDAQQANKLWLTAAAVSAFLYVWFEGVAVRTIVKSAGFVQSRVNGLLYAASDVYFSAITPSATGGQPASAYFMTLDGIPAGTAAAALVLNLMMYTVSVVVLGIISVILSPGAFFGFSLLSRILIVMGAAVLSLLSAAFMLFLIKGELIFSALRRFIAFMKRKGFVKKSDVLTEKLEKAERDYSSCADMFSKDKPLLFRAFLWNFLQRASQIAVPALLYVSFGGSIANTGLLFSKQCLITIGYNFVPIPGAMGIADYMMIDGFSDIVGRMDALTLELFSRGASFYVCVTMSAIITLLGYIVKRRKKAY